MNLKIRKHLVSLLAFTIYIVFLVGSAAKMPVSTQLKVGNFDYTPPMVAGAKSTKIAFALISPSYAPNFQYTDVAPFSDFKKRMEADFEELIIARGYSIRGPFVSRDSMVYSDKEQSDLTLAIELDVNINQTTPSPWLIVHRSRQPQFAYQGTIVLSGKVNLTIAEATTGEKLWAKSISLPQQSVTVASERSYANINVVPVSDPGIHNPLTVAMEQYYTTIMRTAWGHLEPIEIDNLKSQAKEIKKKAVYVK